MSEILEGIVPAEEDMNHFVMVARCARCTRVVAVLTASSLVVAGRHAWRVKGGPQSLVRDPCQFCGHFEAPAQDGTKQHLVMVSARFIPEAGFLPFSWFNPATWFRSAQPKGSWHVGGSIERGD